MKKKILFLLTTSLLFTILLTGCGPSKKDQQLYDQYKDLYRQHLIEECIAGQKAEGHIDVKVKLSYTEIQYSHLGTDISISTTCNGTEIYSGDIVSVAFPTGGLQFKTTIVEHDTIPDRGSNSTYISCSSIPDDGSSVSGTIYCTVREKGGTKYPNAYAKYEITYTVTPITNIGELIFDDVVEFAKQAEPAGADPAR